MKVGEGEFRGKMWRWGRLSLNGNAIFKMNNVLSLHVPQTSTESRYGKLSEYVYAGLDKATGEPLLKGLGKLLKKLAKAEVVNST